MGYKVNGLKEVEEFEPHNIKTLKPHNLIQEKLHFRKLNQ